MRDHLWPQLRILPNHPRHPASRRRVPGGLQKRRISPASSRSPEITIALSNGFTPGSLRQDHLRRTMLICLGNGMIEIVLGEHGSILWLFEEFGYRVLHEC